MQTSTTTAPATKPGAGSPWHRWTIPYKRRLLLAHAELQGWRCYWCRVTMAPSARLAERPTLEHLEASSALGRLTFWNTAAACHGCNQDKGHLSEAEYLAVLAVRREAAGAE